MGVVYRAFDTLIERVVALKVISTLIEDKPAARERSSAKRRAAGQLSHPNIITIHDSASTKASFYLAMELLEGEDLPLRRMARPSGFWSLAEGGAAEDICNGLDFVQPGA